MKVFARTWGFLCNRNSLSAEHCRRRYCVKNCTSQQDYAEFANHSFTMETDAVTRLQDEGECEQLHDCVHHAERYREATQSPTEPVGHILRRRPQQPI